MLGDCFFESSCDPLLPCGLSDEDEPVFDGGPDQEVGGPFPGGGPEPGPPAPNEENSSPSSNPFEAADAAGSY